MDDGTGDPHRTGVRESGGMANTTAGTALARYRHLESTGLWSRAPDEKGREVAVRLGQATLTFIDPRSGVALGHWSLPAVRRLAGEVAQGGLTGGTGAGTGVIYAPGRETGETLVLEDPDMIGALDALETAVRFALPRRGRLRGLLLGGLLVSLVGAGLYALPGALARIAARSVPASQRAEIGQHVLDEIRETVGPTCSDRQGLAAMARLSEHLFGPVDTPILLVLPVGPGRPIHLPGGLILLPASLLDEDSPEALAGAALAENLAAERDDPMRALLEWAGPRAMLALMTRGALPPGALDGYGEWLLHEPWSPPDTQSLAAAFARARLALAPYVQWSARVMDIPPVTAEGEERAPEATTSPMPDNDWVALLSVCAR